MLLVNLLLKIAEWIGHAGLAGFLVLFLAQQPELALWSLLVCWCGYSIARFSMLRSHVDSLR